jgi:N-acyl homoserine lactone hydrolase
VAGASISRLSLGHFTAPPDDHRAGKRVVVEGYLVRQRGRTILFDTGLGSDPEADTRFRPFIRPIAEVLAEAGASVDEIDVVVDCHLHVDHAGQNDRFPGRPIVVQRRELALARAGGHTTVAAHDFPGATFVEIDGEHEVLPGVTVVGTPGHTAGHQSLLVETDRELVFLAGQAFQGATEYGMARRAWEMLQAGGDGTPLDGLVPDWFDAIEARRPALVAFAHDTAIWRRERVYGTNSAASPA